MLGLYYFSSYTSRSRWKAANDTSYSFLAGLLKDWLGGIMPILIVTIITVSGILTILCSTIYKNKLNPQGLMSSAFNVKIGWLVLRVLAVFSC